MASTNSNASNASPHRLLATLERPTGSLSISLAAPGRPDLDGSTPAVVLAEVRDGTESAVTISVHELERVARLVADAARLLAAGDPAPDPERVRSARRQRDYLVREAATGDRQAVETLADFDARNRV